MLERIAPCGLHCGRCFAFADGEVRRAAGDLKRSLGNFGSYAARFVTVLQEPRFARYPDFQEFLTLLTETSCRGCRKEACKLFKSCNVRRCSAEHGVEFCYQCERFPCADTGLDENLYRRHVDINRRIREIGLESYYEEVRDKPRY